ncbi:MAG: hypothetical protein H7X79_14115 [Sporomusaceae bacterium]|nr:hypothetical protein [Sporomusaceae bacterium]
MLAIDLVGLLATILLVGLRYPHYVLAAIGIHEFGRIFTVIFLHAHVDSITTAGVFGTMAVSHYNSEILGIVILFSGSLANYITSSIVGGIAFESTANLLNPLVNLRSPFAVVNFRLCIISFLIQVWKNFI